MKSLEQRVADGIRRLPTATDYTIARNMKTQVGEVKRIRKALEEGTLDIEPSPQKSCSFPAGIISGGISLEGKLVAMKKPADSIASNFSKLPKGKGFQLAELARLWGTSEDTIKRHAKNKNCLRFVDLGDGNWHPMVMHPETASKLS